MAGFLNAVSACLVLLMLMAVGYFMGVWGWMTGRSKNLSANLSSTSRCPATAWWACSTTWTGAAWPRRG